jgi:hypothetical protein
MITLLAKKITIALLIIGIGTIVCAGNIDESKYKAVTIQEIIINPDGFKSKRVKIETKMVKIAISIPTYIEQEFSRKKYFYIIINPKTLPLVAKTKEFQDKLKTIKPGTKIKVFGKVKEFRRGKSIKRWRQQRWPKYYILAENIELIEKNKKTEGK